MRVWTLPPFDCVNKVCFRAQIDAPLNLSWSQRQIMPGHVHNFRCFTAPIVLCAIQWSLEPSKHSVAAKVTASSLLLKAGTTFSFTSQSKWNISSFSWKLSIIFFCLKHWGRVHSPNRRWSFLPTLCNSTKVREISSHSRSDYKPHAKRSHEMGNTQLRSVTSLLFLLFQDIKLCRFYFFYRS